MSGEPETSTPNAASSSSDGPTDGASGALDSSREQVAARVDEHPELAVGAAFGGGLLLALILKRLAN